ncbi:MAG: hypothetical protein UT45_C0004G0024 [Candidatus Daviesbacteria bacterium GW2011_GWA2_39_33]|nr:MAG: hypothetical protein UT45_C0004G0024 [Candidatus Daviesbacteria bacterium GW2011_GWA2_39_33]
MYFFRKEVSKMKSDIGQMLVDNLNYNVLIESLSNNDSFTPSQVITLFNLAKKRNSNVEEDVKNWKPTL